jgi:hypothetical protein
MSRSFAREKDLKPAAVRQDRAFPAHEPMQPAELAHQLTARTEIQMIGIAENDLRADFAQMLAG